MVVKMLVKLSPAVCWRSHHGLPRVTPGDLAGRVPGVGKGWLLLVVFSEVLQ